MVAPTMMNSSDPEIDTVPSSDFRRLERCQQGLARNVGPWIDLSRGLGMEQRGPNGHLAGAASEMPMRVQFQAWVNYLTAEAA